MTSRPPHRITPLSWLPWAPPDDTLTRSVVRFTRSRRNTSHFPFVSPLTRLVASNRRSRSARHRDAAQRAVPVGLPPGGGQVDPLGRAGLPVAHEHGRAAVVAADAVGVALDQVGCGRPEGDEAPTGRNADAEAAAVRLGARRSRRSRARWSRCPGRGRTRRSRRWVSPRTRLVASEMKETWRAVGRDYRVRASVPAPLSLGPVRCDAGPHGAAGLAVVDEDVAECRCRRPRRGW